MKVKEVMTKDVVYVDKNVDLNYVLKLMKKHNITKIPVVEDKKLIGVITDNIIAVKLGSIRAKGVPASHFHASSVIDKNVEIVNPETDITEILKTVGEPGPTMLNVVDDDKLIGIITKADLLHLVKSENKIKEIMQENIFSVSPDDRIIHARRIMIDNNIARLPVIDKGNLLGMISDNEIAFSLAYLKKSFPIGKQKHRLDELLVRDHMKTPAVWIDSNFTIKDAAIAMLENNVGSLLIKDNEKIVGIITRTDLLRTINI